MSIEDRRAFLSDLDTVRDALRNFLLIVGQAPHEFSGDCLGVVLINELDRCVDGLLANPEGGRDGKE